MDKEPTSLTINPIKTFSGTIYLPGSKSISNRVLLLAALAKGVTHITNLLKSDDVEHMLRALHTLQVDYHWCQQEMTCRIKGKTQLTVPTQKTIFLGNAGTAMRFLTAVLSLTDNDILLMGDARMHQRPLGHLVEALKQGGAAIDYIGSTGCPPIRLHGGFRGGNIELEGAISSQFLSALLIAAPLAEKNTLITIRDKLVSKPYVAMTIKLMSIFGVNVVNDDYQKFSVQGKQQYRSPGQYHIEGDASSASYFLAGAAISGGPIKVVGIDRASLQGDIGLAPILEKMGATIRWGKNYIECEKKQLTGIDVDLNHMPDAAMTVAITALFAIGPTRIRNIANWRVKETDRLYAMATELRKIGATVTEGPDFITIIPPTGLRSAEIETYNDHRMAMSFSLIALSDDVSVTILNPDCTLKTFPDYFNQFAKLAK